MSICPRCEYPNSTRYSPEIPSSTTSRKKGIIAGVAVAVGVLIVVFTILPIGQIFSVIERNAQESNSDGVPKSTPSSSEGDSILEVPLLSSTPNKEELILYALEKVNKDRVDFGLPPVKLSDNQAAQEHAQDVFETRAISHWMTNGKKPYMTYSRLGDWAMSVRKAMLTLAGLV
jgi:hypothetical protein